MFIISIYNYIAGTGLPTTASGSYTSATPCQNFAFADGGLATKAVDKCSDILACDRDPHRNSSKHTCLPTEVAGKNLIARFQSDKT